MTIENPELSSDESLPVVLQEMNEKGYKNSFYIHNSSLFCEKCKKSHDPKEAEVIEVHRFEGESNPDDESIVFGIQCKICNSKGTLVSAFGPSMSQGEAEVTRLLSDHRDKNKN